MFSPHFSLCFYIIISTSIGLLLATSLFYSLLSSPLSSSSSWSLFSGRSWTPHSTHSTHSTFVNKSPHSTLVDISPWKNVDYYFFFRLQTSCDMGKPVSKPVSVSVTETSGFKEEDHSWSIVNIHLACAVNTVLSICAVIFVICLLVYVVQRLVKRYCKKKRERKERQRRISMLPFNSQATFGTKGEYAFDRYQYQAPGSGRFTDYLEPPPQPQPTRASIHQLLQGLIASAPPPAAAVSPPILPALPPPNVSGQQLGHPIPT
jgi:hypothetical protein